MLPNWQMADNCRVGDVHTTCTETLCPYNVHCCIFSMPLAQSTCAMIRWTLLDNLAVLEQQHFSIHPLSLLFTQYWHSWSPVLCIITLVCNRRFTSDLASVYYIVAFVLWFCFESWFDFISFHPLFN